MTRTKPQSSHAAEALSLVEGLQNRFVRKLETMSENLGSPVAFERVEWLRDEGRHGGGVRYEVGDTPVFDRGSVNVSQVHYDDEPQRRLGSATALSTIIHPRRPQAPSVHMHFSWTEMRHGTGYWRMMADLNPSIPHQEDKDAFVQVLRESAPEEYDEASAQGDRYFYIPALERHRGVTHFYLEGYSTGNFEHDLTLARRVGEAAIDKYVELLGQAHARRDSVDDAERKQQLDYHTLYLFQVLTLDRGTTSGLLVHDQNDIGILGSLPSHVDRALLASWADRVGVPQDVLVRGLVDALPDQKPSPVTLEAKARMARVVRQHYQAHPEALEMQASGNSIPPTVENHQ